MTKTTRLADMLRDSPILRLAGAHSALSAKLVESTGFEAIWASGLEISAQAAVPDANILTMTQALSAASQIAGAVDIPVLADCDSGFGSVNNVIDMIRQYENNGIAGICIEDKQYPKLNSFIEGNQDLAPLDDFVTKIYAATQVRRDPSFTVVARIEALIAGAGMEEALLRADAYTKAGADALLIHSKKSTPDEVYEFRRRYAGPLPLIVVPTTYNSVTATELEAAGFGAVIYANHAVRGSIAAMEDVLAQIYKDGTTFHVEDQIAPLKKVFHLQGMHAMLEQQSRFEKLAAERLAK
ncbi:isocitrate lyase/phosphoenolpyruvate mutase family protein [Actinoplanes sp. L3-i22]|uniref:isocitrate lyase/phosphoenolpyruvate mutase family protein n=1 Tax=Actinoplanes sp. L3-i22 TaxID=2836373 RepID=UPI001C78FE17|nr:isocitrate lyase/phosphoenolpyruvate mutase family protein [Actinoplanes sp. L3-i22]BCY13346.1 hypothetical protein L3i22_084340 [Actinoplanes sp. L3-i22]